MSSARPAQPPSRHRALASDMRSASRRAGATSYRCLSRERYELGDYALRALQPDQLETVRQWRNAQRHVLRQHSAISYEQQRSYYRDIVAPRLRLAHPELILLGFSHRDRDCGYTGLTHIDWQARRAEIAFLADPSRVANEPLYQRDFSSCLQMLKQIAFGELRLERLFAETFDVRPAHIRVLEQSGFRLEGRLRRHVVVEGAAVDSLIHGCLRTDWRAAR